MIYIKHNILLVCLFSLFISHTYAIEDMTVYAETNGTYTYLGKNYTLDGFPVDMVLSDLSSGQNGPTVDSVTPITVEIFPVDSVDINSLRTLVRPLAIRFHRRNAKVNTLFLNKVIPYMFKKPK